MSDDSRFSRNGAASSIVASLMAAVSLFAIFRLSVEASSLAFVGCWSLVQGLFFVARVADVGVGANLTRIMASSDRLGTMVSPRSLFSAGVLLTSLPVLIISAAASPLILGFVSSRFNLVIGESEVAALTFCGLAYAVISSVSGIALAVIEGLGRLVSKNAILATGHGLGVAGVVPLLHYAGPVGVGLIYVIVVFVQTCMAISLLAYLFRGNPVPGQVRPSQLVAELWRENLRMNAIGMLRLSFEPTTKFLLGLNGNAATIASFDLALKVCTQVRSLIQSGLQPLLVLGARKGDSGERHTSFDTLGRIIFVAGWVSSGLISLTAPIIAILGIGDPRADFVVFVWIISIGSAINTLGMVNYYDLLSRGDLRPLIVIHCVMAVLNVGAGSVLLWLLGPIGSVTAYGLIFCAGGLLLWGLDANLPKSVVAKFVLLVRQNAGFLLVSVIGVVGGALSTRELGHGHGGYGWLVQLVFSTFLVVGYSVAYVFHKASQKGSAE